jgi:hypothetical protein
MKLLIMQKLILAGLIILISSSISIGGTLETYSSSGIHDVDGAAYLSGNTTSGALVQLILAGANGVADVPDTLGNPTGDDVLLGTTHVGYGFPFNPNEGKFSITFTHESLILGATVFVRAWNVAAPISSDDYYGDSISYQLISEMDSHNFGTWTASIPVHVPVELAKFSVEAKPGYIMVSWTTQSETENLGFQIYKSASKDGEKEQVNNKIINGAINSQTRSDYNFEDRDVSANATYYYWLGDVSLDGTIAYHGPIKVIAMASPTEYGLEQNYPNPFNPTTSVTYSLKEDGQVSLSVYNMLGQLVRTLVNVNQLAGEHTIVWDGLNDRGMLVPTGMYFYVLEVNGFHSVRKMAMMK